MSTTKSQILIMYWPECSKNKQNFQFFNRDLVITAVRENSISAYHEA